MATLVYVDQENDGIRTPAPSKQRARLQSAPGGVYAEKCLKTPLSSRNHPQSGRKALGPLNKVCAAVSSSTQESRKPGVAIPARAKAEKNAEEYPEVEKFIPYNPLDFESFEVPEEVRLSHLCLAGLSSVSGPPVLPEDDELDELEPCPPTSPVQMRRGFSAELEAFLQTVNQLTVDLPPEMED
ncbi:securin [Scleropages formosus]|uniref:Securin n=1 Tax=Scleropages formosus TaxID=113540 RepID=A0A8C9V6F8_SCLFO|nr:securin-like [Scleropages formosus]